MSLECHWNVVGMSLECRWNVIGMSLECHWNVVGMSLECRWNVIGMSLECTRYIIIGRRNELWTTAKFCRTALRSQMIDLDDYYKVNHLRLVGKG